MSGRSEEPIPDKAGVFSLKNTKTRWALFLIAFGTTIAFGALLWLATPQAVYEAALTAMDAILAWLRERPVLLWAGIALLPGLGLPVSPLLVAAGAVWFPRFGVFWSCVLVWSAIFVCMVWNYWVARSGVREWVGKLLVKRQQRLPHGESRGFTVLAILIRLTPGIPLFLQNYFLGFMRMPFGRYLLVSGIVQAVYVPAYVVGGGALIEGRLQLLLLAGSMVVLLGLIAYSVRHRLEKNSATRI